MLRIKAIPFVLLLVFVGFESRAQKRISADDALDNVGLYVRVCERVVDGVFLENTPSKVTLLNLGDAYPNQKLTVVINYDNRKNFQARPEEYYIGKFICVVGKVETRNDRPQIEIFTPPVVMDSAAVDSFYGRVATPVINPQQPPLSPKKIGRSKTEIGISVGTMHTLTDVGRKESEFGSLTQMVRMQGGVYGQYNFSRSFATRLEVNLGSVAADDANGKAVVQQRKLSFRSKIFEVAATGIVTPIHFRGGGIYFLAGIGVFSFDPETTYKGTWVKLQPLHTEGQGFPEFPGRKAYSLTQICVPVGGGMQFDLSKAVALKLEANLRWTSTDYLDDASTLFIDPSLFNKNLPSETAKIAMEVANPNPSYNVPNAMIRGGQNSNDMYMTFAIKLGYKFKN